MTGDRPGTGRRGEPPGPAAATAGDVLAALAEVRRRGQWPLFQRWEQEEPDLAGHAMEELSLVHRTLTDSGASPRAALRLQRQVQRLVLVCVLATRAAASAAAGGDEPGPDRRPETPPPVPPGGGGGGGGGPSD